jgi:hypothetical protein
MLRPFLDGPEPNDAFSINGIDIARDYDIRKLLSPQKWITARISSDIGNTKRMSQSRRIPALMAD